MNKQKLIKNIIECENAIKKLPNADIKVLMNFNTSELKKLNDEYEKSLEQLGNLAKTHIKIATKYLNNDLDDILITLLKL